MTIFDIMSERPWRRSVGVRDGCVWWFDGLWQGAVNHRVSLRWLKNRSKRWFWSWRTRKNGGVCGQRRRVLPVDPARSRLWCMCSKAGLPRSRSKQLECYRGWRIRRRESRWSGCWTIRKKRSAKRGRRRWSRWPASWMPTRRPLWFNTCIRRRTTR